MSQNPQNITNPGSVNVADEGDGLTVVDQPVTTGPSTNPGPLIQAGSEGFGVGVADPDQPVTVEPSQNSATGVTNAGSYSPQSSDTINVIQNTVVNQIYGQGNPENVFV